MNAKGICLAIGISIVCIAAPNLALAQTEYGLNASAGSWATAIGPNTNASGTGSVAVGSGAQATGLRSIATGVSAEATGSHSVAHGQYSNATGENSIAVGYRSDASGQGSVATGTSSAASGYHSSAYGPNSEASGGNSSAFGTGSQAQGEGSSAVGYNALATHDNSVAIGARSQATQENSVALGAGSRANRGASSNYDAPYLNTPQSSSGELSVGRSGAERQITNVAAGFAPTDAVNVAQLHGAVDYLSQDIHRLGIEVDAAKDLARAAGALGLAASQIRYDDRPGKLSLGLGTGAFSGHGAVAVGLGYTSQDLNWRANISGGVARGSEAGIGAGVSFTLN